MELAGMVRVNLKGWKRDENKAFDDLLHALRNHILKERIREYIKCKKAARKIQR